jgi:hypothetical protein
MQRRGPGPGVNKRLRDVFRPNTQNAHRSARVRRWAIRWTSQNWTQRTRLWRWIVYSRATTSAMALRWVLPAGFLPLAFAEGAIAREEDMRLAEALANALDVTDSSPNCGTAQIWGNAIMDQGAESY